MPTKTVKKKYRPARRLLAALHHGLALLGLLVLLGAGALLARPGMRDAAQQRASDWLAARQAPDLAADRAAPVPDSREFQRLSATFLAHMVDAPGADSLKNPQELPAEQAAITRWLSKKYRIAAEPLAALVSEAWRLGARTEIDPALILAVMAIESRFNPFAQSHVGAQGLMQVMTRVHADKYDAFGGRHAAFDPLSNLHVGVQVLRDCIKRFGSVEGGLRCYVGAAHLPGDGGYAAKVLAEHQRLRAAASNAQVRIITADAHPVAWKPAPAAPGKLPALPPDA